MSYQVLARKYRPGTFDQMVGQDHVLRALVNALEKDRLHHAYLFTGTRGVGKTSVARIFARCLNCAAGVTASPCGECASCVEIGEGRSIDLIEVDAASRTRVEDTRDLLDNVQYMPTNSRFKVYLIDEVHMLSGHSFNALLKTLEEPPPHVKFLLATTDPKKLPVTVLSRCLQFNLKNLTPEKIVSYLKGILDNEQVPYDEAALWQLARAADGSMRDALSLTDQAISFGDNSLGEDDVKQMLGSIDRRDVLELLDCLVSQDVAQLLEKIAHVAEFAPDYDQLLAEIMSVLHRIAVTQSVQHIDSSHGDREEIAHLAASFTAEDVQLYYQIALLGRRDLALAPDVRDGFEMAMLRMIAFSPDVTPADVVRETAGPAAAENAVSRATSGPATGQETKAAASGVTEGQKGAAVAERSSAGERPSSTEVPAASVANAGEPSADAPAEEAPVPTGQTSMDRGRTSAEPMHTSTEPRQPQTEREPATGPGPTRTAVTPTSTEANQTPTTGNSPRTAAPDEPQVAEHDAGGVVGMESGTSAEGTRRRRAGSEPQEPPQREEPAKTVASLADNAAWLQVFPTLGLGGVTEELAANCSFERATDGVMEFKLREEHASLWNETHERRLADALTGRLGGKVAVRIGIGMVDDETPAMQRQRELERRQAEAVKAIENDKNVRSLLDQFDGKLEPRSITPLN